jgi:hypothetical protein
MDTGETDHLTNNMDRLSVQIKEPYHGKHQVQVFNSAGLSITHVGHSRLVGSLKAVDLKTIHGISKRMVSIYHLIFDIFNKFYKYFFFVKDKVSGGNHSSY